MPQPRNSARAPWYLACVAMGLQGCAGVPKSCRGLDIAALAGAADSDGPGLQCRADRGDTQAAVALGRRYELGDGVARDPRRAAQLYQAAATAIPKTTAIYAPPVRVGGRGQMLLIANPNAGAGSAAAQFYLGRMYLDGRGVEQDPKQGKLLVARAAAQGFPGAAELLERLAP